MNEDVHILAREVLDKSRAKGLSIATAESCTGGGIGAALTSVPGSSDIFLGGVIAYANRIKHDVLGVPEDTLTQYGAVSGPVAKAMAEGVLRLTGADLTVAVTGIAGPGGGTPEKPVGTVWIAVAKRHHDHIHCAARLHNFKDQGREPIRNATIRAALEMLMASLA